MAQRDTTSLTPGFSSWERIFSLCFQVFAGCVLFAYKPLIFWIAWKIVTSQNRRRHLPWGSKNFNDHCIAILLHFFPVVCEPGASKRDSFLSLVSRAGRHEEQTHSQPVAERRNERGMMSVVNSEIQGLLSSEPLLKENWQKQTISLFKFNLHLVY